MSPTTPPPRASTAQSRFIFDSTSASNTRETVASVLWASPSGRRQRPTLKPVSAASSRGDQSGATVTLLTSMTSRARTRASSSPASPSRPGPTRMG